MKKGLAVAIRSGPSMDTISPSVYCVNTLSFLLYVNRVRTLVDLGGVTEGKKHTAAELVSYIQAKTQHWTFANLDHENLKQPFVSYLSN